MDFIDFIKANAGRDVDVVTFGIPRDDMKELIVVIAVNTAVIESVMRDYHGKMTKIDVLGLENAITFGKSAVNMLSLITGITQGELADELNHFVKNARSETAQKMKVHMNKSKENLDSFVLRMFGEEGT